MWTFMLHIYAVGKPKRKPPVKAHYSVEIVYYDKYLLNDSIIYSTLVIEAQL